MLEARGEPASLRSVGSGRSAADSAPADPKAATDLPRCRVVLVHLWEWDELIPRCAEHWNRPAEMFNNPVIRVVENVNRVVWRAPRTDVQLSGVAEAKGATWEEMDNGAGIDDVSVLSYPAGLKKDGARMLRPSYCHIN